MQMSWSPPSNSWSKLNFDESKLAFGQASFGFSIRNHLGDLSLAWAMALSSDCSILKVEAWGLLEGLGAARFLVISSLVIEGDNLVVINSLRRCWKVA